MSSEGLRDKAIVAVLEKLGWARQKLAGNTFNTVSEECVKMYKEASGDVDPEEILNREFVKEHDGESYRIRFEHPKDGDSSD
jgi:hypothetical protein